MWKITAMLLRRDLLRQRRLVEQQKVEDYLQKATIFKQIVEQGQEIAGEIDQLGADLSTMMEVLQGKQPPMPKE